jgi:hypothetical protein
MKGRVLALGLLLALFAVFLTRGAGPGPAPPPAETFPIEAAPATQPTAAIPDLGRARDPFRYLEEPAPLRSDPRPPPRALEEEIAAVAPSPPPIRVLGFIRRGDSLLAALSVHGVVVTAGVGESAESHLVLAIDEDAGVRLRAPDGAEVLLVPQSE